VRLIYEIAACGNRFIIANHSTVLMAILDIELIQVFKTNYDDNDIVQL